MLTPAELALLEEAERAEHPGPRGRERVRRVPPVDLDAEPVSILPPDFTQEPYRAP